MKVTFEILFKSASSSIVIFSGLFVYFSGFALTSAKSGSSSFIERVEYSYPFSTIGMKSDGRYSFASLSFSAVEISLSSFDTDNLLTSYPSLKYTVSGLNSETIGLFPCFFNSADKSGSMFLTFNVRTSDALCGLDGFCFSSFSTSFILL